MKKVQEFAAEKGLTRDIFSKEQTTWDCYQKGMARESTIKKFPKITADKAFRALPRNEGDEFFRIGIFEFNITQLAAFIQEHPHVVSKEEIEVATLRDFSLEPLDESTIESANFEVPIILAEISPGKFNIIDGNHRLEKAFRNGIRKILSFRVGPKHHCHFLTSEKAYLTYISYWNSKVDEMEQ